MPNVTAPVILDSTGQRIAAALEGMAGKAQNRVLSLDNTRLASGIIEVIGIPEYVEDVEPYSAYGLADTGWYVFARISAPDGVTVSALTTVTGAAGAIVTTGAEYIDVAVRFEVAAASQVIAVIWDGSHSDTFIFKASDLAVRNLDYMTTFYVYDISRYVTWEYALTTDTVFAANKQYFTRDGDTYTLAEVETVAYVLTADTTFTEGKTYYTKDGDTYTAATVTAGEAVPENTYYEQTTVPVPADTYYNHSLLTIAGMIKNVTYELNEIVDCGMQIVLPAVEEDGHGVWFDFHFYHSASGSVELVTPAGVKKATATGSAAVTAGVNAIELRYTTAKEKLWSMFNEHTNVPAS